MEVRDSLKHVHQNKIAGVNLGNQGQQKNRFYLMYNLPTE